MTIHDRPCSYQCKAARNTTSDPDTIAPQAAVTVAAIRMLQALADAGLADHYGIVRKAMSKLTTDDLHTLQAVLAGGDHHAG